MPHSPRNRRALRALRRATRLPSPFVALLLAAAAPPALAEWDVDGLEELIPHHETRLERDRLLESGGRPIDPRGLRADPPPTAPVRNCAEWEPVTGVLVRYPLGVPYSLLRDLDDVVTLHVIVSSGYLNQAKSNLAAGGVDTTMVDWLVKPNDTIWVRDYGPWFVFDGNGDLGIIDHVYNRPWRPNDDRIPSEFGAEYGIPVFEHDMWHTGGNYMCDGAHFAMSTDLVYDEALAHNGMTPAQVDQLMFDYYGITDYRVIDDISSGGIHHIDTWAKFLDEETVLIKEVWPSHYTYSNLEQRATLIASLLASTGRPYEVVRVYCQNIGGGEPASYTNSLFVNDGIYVPMFSNATGDSAALDVYRAAAPGYIVRGYAYGGWLTDDALHCRAKGVMDAGMLRVAHVPVVGDVAGPVVIRALVDDRSLQGIASVDLHYRLDGGSWTALGMSAVGGDEYEAMIPASSVEAIADYYVLASDRSGREEGSPRVAPDAWHTFTLLPSGTGVGDRVADGRAPLAFPNPFLDRTRFSFELKHPDRVELAVYDVAGRRVRHLLAERRDSGLHEIEWDGRDETGRRVPSGVYYFRLRAAGIVHTRPVVLTR